MTNIKATKRALLSSVMALFLCFAMLIGTTYAWFTDEVTSEGNIIQTGSLDVGFEWADGKEDPATATWTDASKGAIFDYANWEPGYAVARHLKVTNEGTLALNYRMRIVANGIVSKLADVIDVYVIADPDAAATKDLLTDNNKIGTLTQVLLASGANNAVNDADKGVDISKIIKGSLKVDDDADIYTIVLKMNEKAGNDYQDMDLGCTFSVQLLATQMSAESDSFDNLYDAVVPNEAIPAALVRPLENRNVIYTVNGWDNGTEVNKTLDVAYTFQPTEDEIDLSFYQHWMADYVVSADRDVPANSIALAGYYSVMCDGFNNGNWVALTSDEDIAAETEIPLVETMAWPVHYSDIVEFGTDGIGFRCGAVALDDSIIGTTITVELRIYETEAAWDDSSASSVKTGKYITIGEFKYTFTKAVENADELAAAVANGAELITLTEDVVLNDAPLTVPADGKVTIDLNGKTLSGVSTAASTSYLVNVAKGGELTLKNGTVSFYGTTPDTQWGGVGQPAFPGYATNTIKNLGKLIIDGATVENTTARGGASYAIDCYEGSELIVNSGKIDGCGKTAIRMFCNSNTLTTKVTVNGGTITGTRAIWVHLPSGNINNVRPVVLTVNGGDLICTDTENDLCIYGYSYGDSFADTSIVINGGNFTGDIGCYGADVTADVYTINGGNFNGEVGYWNNDNWIKLS